jgi:hypothetical protein
MNEMIFLGGCPVIKPDGIYYEGRRVIRLGMGDVGVGDVGDLLAYRQEWEPYISAHIALWRNLNALLEGNAAAQKCPPGIFTAAQIKDPDPTTRAFCMSLAFTRIRISDTDPGGILTQWNAWKDKSSADILAGASSMLAWHQDVVMRVGGTYAKDLLEIAKFWGIPVQLPDVPSFSLQQEIRARIEGAYISTKGVIQLIGYSASELLGEAHDLVQATAQGLTDAAKGIPKAINWAFIVGAVAVAVVGGALVVYYLPRKAAPAAAPVTD